MNIAPGSDGLDGGLRVWGRGGSERWRSLKTDVNDDARMFAECDK